MVTCTCRKLNWFAGSGVCYKIYQTFLFTSGPTVLWWTKVLSSKHDWWSRTGVFFYSKVSSMSLGAVPSWLVLWLVCSSLKWVVFVWALARDIALYPWARRFTLTVPLSTLVYKWVLENLMLGVTLLWTSIPSRGGGGGMEILHLASCDWNQRWPPAWRTIWLVCRLQFYVALSSYTVTRHVSSVIFVSFVALRFCDLDLLT